MAQNTLPSGIHDLLWLAAHMHEGRETLGPWLRIGTAEEFGAALAEMRAAESAWTTARARKADAGRRGAAADAALTAWLAKARLVLMLALGSAWSERWVEAGFTQRGTHVPKRLGARIELGRCLVEFFEQHPEYAVPFAHVTAATGQSLHEESTAATRTMRDTARAAGESLRVRDATEKRLRWLMRGTRVMLSFALDRSDPRWHAFGLHIPAPDAPARPRRTLPTPAEVVPLPPEPAPLLREVA